MMGGVDGVGGEGLIEMKRGRFYGSNDEADDDEDDVDDTVGKGRRRRGVGGIGGGVEY